MNKSTATVTTLSVYHFANLIGKRPQQLYGMIANGSFPKELYHEVKTPSGNTTQPMVHVEDAKAWFASKDEVRTEKAVQKIVSQPELIVDAFIQMVEKDDPKLGKAIRTWWTKKNTKEVK